MTVAINLVPLEQAERQQFDKPLPLFEKAAPAAEYPVASLGPVLSRAAVAVARKIQVPFALAAQSVLATASLAAQAHKDVQLPFGQTRPLSLYLITVAASGDRKSSADNEALWPIRRREQLLQEERSATLEESDIKRAAHAAQKRKIEADKTLELVDRENELRNLGSEPPLPLYPLLTAPDPTVEALARIWPNAPASLGIFSAEGGAFVGGHGMSVDHRLKTAATLSELWDGRGMRRLRAGDGLTILNGRRLAMHLMLQPDSSEGFLCDPVLRDQGLLSRLLIAAPQGMAGNRPYRDADEEDNRVIRAYGARLLSILEAPWPLAADQRSEIDPPALHLSAAACASWKQFFNHVEQRMGPDGELVAIKDFAAKAAEQAARIAGVITVIADLDATEISAEAMTGAIELTDWYIAEHARLASVVRVDPKLQRADRLLSWLKVEGAGGAPVAQRRIMQFGPNAIRAKATCDEAIKILIDHGHVETAGDRPARFKLTKGAQ